MLGDTVFVDRSRVTERDLLMFLLEAGSMQLAGDKLVRRGCDFVHRTVRSESLARLGILWSHADSDCFSLSFKHVAIPLLS